MGIVPFTKQELMWMKEHLPTREDIHEKDYLEGIGNGPNDYKTTNEALQACQEDKTISEKIQRKIVFALR